MWLDEESEPWSTDCEAIALTSTPLRRHNCMVVAVRKIPTLFFAADIMGVTWPDSALHVLTIRQFSANVWQKSIE